MEPNHLQIHDSSTMTSNSCCINLTAQALSRSSCSSLTTDEDKRPLHRAILAGKGKGGRTVYGRIGVEAVDLGDERELGDVLREVDVDGADADLGAGLALHIDVRLRVLPAPHDHHRQPGHLRGRGAGTSPRASVPNRAPRSEKKPPAAVRSRGMEPLTRLWAEVSLATSAATSRRTSAAMALPSMICAIAAPDFFFSCLLTWSCFVASGGRQSADEYLIRSDED